MTTFHSNEDVTDFNQGALEELTRAIEWNNEGQFALILARCNSSNVRRRLVQSLQKLCSVEIREIVLNKSVKTLYTTIQTELSQTQEQPQALMVSGLESVIALEQLLTGANQVREEFRKNFHFPLVWWVTDEVLQKLIRLAPDFQSWATTVEFEIATDELIQFIQETANEVFNKVLETGAGIFLDNTALNLGIGSPLRAELESGQKELQLRGVQLDLQLEASLEFVLGRVADGFQEQSRQHYERSLNLWQRCPNWERVGCVLYSLGLWWYSYAVKHRAEYEPACDRTKDYFQQCIQVFEQHQRNDLVAKFINALGEILQRLQQWDELETVAETALALHQTYPDPFRLARAYGFLAEVQLAKSHWIQARESAEQALSIFNSATSSSLTSVSSEMSAHLDLELSYHQGWYLFSLAKAQKGLSQSQDSLKNLEKALDQTKPQYDPQLYIRILKELRDGYFKQGEYLKAFGFKQDQRGIEGQYGFRAFIGAGRLRPSQQVSNPALTLGESQGTIPQEITASGRQEDVNKLVVRISRPDHKLTVIYGQSGVGKSSLLQAGLIPALKQKSIGICDVSVVLQQVYTDWLRELSQKFKEELERLKEFRGIVLLSETLDSTEALLKQLQENADQNLLTVLIFDQFEEFFFVCKDHTQRQVFYELLHGSLKCPSVKVILSLREDYLHYLLEFNRVCDLEVINNNILDKDIIYYLGNFSPANAESIIQSLTEQAQLTLEPSLINELVQDLSRELGEVRPIELQVVGAQLQTENITTLTQYREHGLKGKLVQRYLEELVEDCGLENQQVAQTLLYLLTDENNTRPLKTRVDLEGALKSLADAEQTKKLDLVLEIFVQSGLVVLLPEITANRYQLVHDYLVSFIRQQQNTELIEKLKEAEEQKKEAEEQKRLSEAKRKISETKLNSFLKWALAGSLIAGLILTVLTVVSVRSARQARNSEFKARSSYTEALFTSNKELEALIESLKLGQQLKQPGGLAEDTKVRGLAVLEKVVYGVRERNRLLGHNYGVYSVSFSPDGQTIASASADNTLKLWRSDGLLLNTLKGHTDNVIGVSFSPDGQTIASASADKTLKLWKRDGTLLQTLPNHTDQVNSVSFSPDSQTIVSGSTDKTVRLWNRDGTLLKTLNGHKDTVLCASFSPDGKTIASASADKTVKLWNRDGTFLKTLNGHSDAVYSVSFSPDGQTLASASFDKTIKIWRLDGQLLKTLQSHNDGVKSVSFSPDGQTIVSGSVDATVKLWRLDGQLLKTLQGHSNRVNSVNFSPDGKTIASASTDNTVILWDWEQWSTHLDELLLKGCNWAHDYLKNNPTISESDRTLCDGIPTRQ
jgi:WD40 repeat protein